jgi:surface protein
MLSPLFFSTHFYPWTFLCCCGAVFYKAGDFNGDLSTWQVGEVTTMFDSTYTLSSPLLDRVFFWLLLHVYSPLLFFFFPTHFYPWTFVCCYGAVFNHAGAFNGDLSTWKVEKVTNMQASTYILSPLSLIGSFFGSLFLFAAALILFLNNALSSFFHFYPWTFLCCCAAVFQYARAFNGDLSAWLVGKVTTMAYSTFTLSPLSKIESLFWLLLFPFFFLWQH